MHETRSASDKSSRYRFNFLSGSGGSFPYFVASGHSNPATGAPRLSTGLTTLTNPNTYPDFPRTACALGICTISFEGTNNLYRAHMAGGHTGVVFMDFPGHALVRKIFMQNPVATKALLTHHKKFVAPANQGPVALVT